MPIRCSACVLTFNSGKTLRQTLESVKDFSDIVIMDGGSNDETLQIAGQYNARIFPQHEDGSSGRIEDFTAIRERLFSKAAEDWIIYIDSDEYLSEDARKKIAAIVNNGSEKNFVYTLNREAVINNKIVRHAYYYPQRTKRLWNKNAPVHLKKGKVVHEDMIAGEGVSVVNLDAVLYHDWHESSKDFIEKDNYYLELAMRGRERMVFGAKLRKALINVLKAANVFWRSVLIYLRHGYKDSLPIKCVWRFIRYHLIFAKKIICYKYKFPTVKNPENRNIQKNRFETKILFIAGARPNFMKVSALMHAARKKWGEDGCAWIHTGQHYNNELSQVFLDEFKMPEPIANLQVGSGGRREQIRLIIERLSVYLKSLSPEMVVVVGDVNSTLAAALACMQLGIPLAHVEAGLRSFNWRMPEEINRVMTDHISDLLFATEESAVNNLKNEGVDMSKVHLTGNVMIDTLNFFVNTPGSLDAVLAHGLKPRGYALATLHRSENVDDAESLKQMLEAFCDINRFIPVVCSLHPRTLKALDNFGIQFGGGDNPIKIIPPQPYNDFLKLQQNAKFILTDSGGIQEEASILGVPCITLRTETERPITCEYGTNEVVGVKKEKIIEAAKRAYEGKWKKSSGIPLWDGNASFRIMEIIGKYLGA